MSLKKTQLRRIYLHGIPLKDFCFSRIQNMVNSLNAIENVQFDE